MKDATKERGKHDIYAPELTNHVVGGWPARLQSLVTGVLQSGSRLEISIYTGTHDAREYGSKLYNSSWRGLSFPPADFSVLAMYSQWSIPSRAPALMSGEPRAKRSTGREQQMNGV